MVNIFVSNSEIESDLVVGSMTAMVKDDDPAYVDLSVTLSIGGGSTLKRGVHMLKVDGSYTNYVTHVESGLSIRFLGGGGPVAEAWEHLDWYMLRHPELWADSAPASDYFWFLSQIYVERKAILDAL